MTPSSRTPEGQPHRCPICGKELRIEPSQPSGDAPCPYCGGLLWFDQSGTPHDCRERVEETKAQIRDLVRQITELGQRADVAPADYYAAFLSNVVCALAAKGGALWTPAPPRLRLTCGLDLAVARLGKRLLQRGHETLLLQTLASGEAAVVPPRENRGTSSGCNPTDWLLVLSPIKMHGRTIALAEIFQRTEARASVQRGYQRFLMQMCELAGRSIALEQAEWEPGVQPKPTPWWKFWKRR